ncbi:shikimate dehydrogenase [Sphaerochaeta sp. PS]|uniref:shikimate dehydrogenase n=1 Tax=Sphaerochaeta sp. PS TaxID=3076336 RepID=UPI0028A30738|nr:shikimate dehydrogenase [Sphaerochaeta sp. PS]MDT4762864.1 shikimate dehydrogenase [Sphaerochaeta sp. PS]
MLCLTLTGSTLEENRALVQQNRKWISLAELRLDYLQADEQKIASSFPSTVDIPVILTLRRQSDGGKCTLSEKQRLQTLYESAKGDFAFVDIEEDVKKSDLKFKDPLFENKVDFELSLRQRGVRIIRSFHDFTCVPADIYGRISKLAAKGDIPKVAVTPKSMIDVIALFRAQQELSSIKEKIIIGMGEFGVCTRILYKKCGSMLSFCSAGEGAPGQLSAQVMSELYRADKLDEKTHVFGIIGNPVYHTASPRIHNPGFEAIHYNAVYVPFLVDSVRAFFKLAEMLQIHGFSVTVPHKRNVQPYLGRITREVKQIGACNTVTRIQNMWKGTNTDYYGFLAPIADEIAQGSIRTALVIGAGGASRAVVWALHNHGVKVTIINRSVEHAKLLSDETMSSFDSLEHCNRYSGAVDLVVQTTSVGMAPNLDEDPVPSFVFSGKEIVYELVYQPKETPFFRRATQAGCHVIGGAQMLIEQGKLQFESFTGYHYPHWVHPEI